MLCLDISRQNAKNAFQSDENTIKMLFSLVEKGFQQNSVKYLQKNLLILLKLSSIRPKLRSIGPKLSFYDILWRTMLQYPVQKKPGLKAPGE